MTGKELLKIVKAGDGISRKIWNTDRNLIVNSDGKTFNVGNLTDISIDGIIGDDWEVKKIHYVRYMKSIKCYRDCTRDEATHLLTEVLSYEIL